MTDPERVIWLICWFGASALVSWLFIRQEEKKRAKNDVDEELQHNLQQTLLRRRRKEVRR